MIKAKVIALRKNALGPAYESAANSAYKLIDFMYGTEDRTKVTFAFSLALIVLGMFLNSPQPSDYAVCAL